MVHLMKMMIVVGLVLLVVGCTSLKYENKEGAKIEVWSFLSNKRVSGTLKADGNKRTLIVNEFDENQTDGAAKIVGAAVEAAIKSRP
jgi:hypothetical protein